jgi:putative membrane protein
MSPHALPYCGAAPHPGELLQRFNLDPALLASLALLAIFHARCVKGMSRAAALSGWAIATVALVSPLCALSVALFSARVGQLMILVLLAAPLIALAWPAPLPQPRMGRTWLFATAFFVFLWLWHMPRPYDATFSSTLIYWSMHVTLFGSAILLWRDLLHHSAARGAEVLVIGTLTSMQMGLLGAILTFASRPLFFWHLTTTTPWGLSALRDQQLGGVLMWVPGIAFFLFVALWSLGRFWKHLDAEKVA